MKMPFLLLALIFLNLPLVCAATIHGVVYDDELNPAKNVVIKVNSAPEQTFVAKDGTYSFNLQPGSYVLQATHKKDYTDYKAEESIEIKDEGNYVLDLILFPDISEEDELLNEEVNISYSGIEGEEVTIWVYASAAFIVVAIIFFIFYKKKEPAKKETLGAEEDAEKVIAFIKEKGGRITQKEVRKHFPVSEAKISLIISELEHKGIIQKFKKGRGNIIILNKKI